jgi:UV-stimulated scaffold protein A
MAAESSIASLIERATSTTEPSVDPALLRAIKAAARASDGAIRDAFHLLLSLMSKPHSHVRKSLSILRFNPQSHRTLTF